MFGQTCGNCRQLFLLLAGHGCGLHPAFPAPSSISGANLRQKLGRVSAAGTLRLCSKMLATFSAVMPRFKRGIQYSRDDRA
jgi:hypothetical protein